MVQDLRGSVELHVRPQHFAQVVLPVSILGDAFALAVARRGLHAAFGHELLVISGSEVGSNMSRSQSSSEEAHSKDCRVSARQTCSTFVRDVMETVGIENE